MIIRQIAFTDPEFQQCFTIRRQVFVEEQNVPLEDEHDEYDAAALHFLAVREAVAVGTARVVFKDAGATAKITRVAVLQSARGFGVGAALMRHIETAVSAAQFVLDAQIHALVFYQRLGYAAFGEAFLEAGIPHRHMRKEA